MWDMATDALEKEILERLKDGENRDDIILSIAEREGLGWQEVESTLNAAETEHASDITLAQSPLLVLLALGIFLAGIALIGVAVHDIAQTFNAYASEKGLTGVGFVFYMFTYGGYFWELALLGMAMVFGSLRGMQDVWTALFDRLNIQF